MPARCSSAYPPPARAIRSGYGVAGGVAVEAGAEGAPARLHLGTEKPVVVESPTATYASPAPVPVSIPATGGFMVNAASRTLSSCEGFAVRTATVVSPSATNGARSYDSSSERGPAGPAGGPVG